MPPPKSRPSTTRSQSAMSTLQSKGRLGAASPAEHSASSLMNQSQSRSPQKASAGVKRKERDFDADASEESNIHVVVRCRGRNDREVRENSGVVVSTDGVKGQHVELSMGPSALSNKTYRFDKVFSPAADQSMMYDEVVAPILDEMLAGYNCTVFAYGQTGTGKTYTMSGDMSDTLGLVSDSAGIIPRVLSSLFSKLDADEGESSVKCSFIELYNEELRDLLSPDDGVKLKIYEDGQKKGHNATMVQGMEESHIKNAADGIRLLQGGSHKRQVAATKCNDLSSRSHTVFTVTAYIKRATDAGEDFVSAGKLNLVDLAGSENIQRSGAENKRAAEAGLINKSLLTLGRVINALVERSSHIPYRESKLTRLLQDSLGGRTKTCIIATVSPAKSNLEETISTLDYAFRAKNIKNKPQINSMINKKTLLKEFAAEIEKLKTELIATRQRNGVYLTAEGYDEIMGQSESRRILSEEQKERIDTMEVSLRNKVQELFNLANTFAAVKRDAENTRQSLLDAKELLQKTELILADTRRSLADESLLREAHQTTEGRLLNTGEELKSTLEETISDIGGLHAKIKRKLDLQTFNREGWQASRDQVTSTTNSAEATVEQFKLKQTQMISQLSNRVQDFVREELEKLDWTQDFLKFKANAFQTSEQEAVEQTCRSKEDMNVVLEEIKELREEVKQKVNDGLEGLSSAAERISAGVVNELGVFHTQLHTSYSSLGKEFKGIFDDLTRHLKAQRSEIDGLKSKMSASARSTIQTDELVSARMEAALREERDIAAQKRQALLSQITNLVNKSAEQQERRSVMKVQELQHQLLSSRSGLASADEEFNSGVGHWSSREVAFTNSVLESRDSIKLKLKEDWKAINERNDSIHSTTKSVHEETVRIVDAQMITVAKQMQALDDFVARARSHNERHHDQHTASLGRLASVVNDSHSSVGKHFMSTYDRIREAGNELSNRSDELGMNIPSFSGALEANLADLRANIINSAPVEYVPTGLTPQRKEYEYTKTLPRTDAHENLLGRKPRNAYSPSKSPSKPKVYADAPSAEMPPALSSSTKDAGLREISLNVGAALHRNNSDSAVLNLQSAVKHVGDKVSGGPPPLKRQATESKLPTKLGGGRGGLVKLEGNENLGASVGSGGRRLRSSPGD